MMAVWLRLLTLILGFGSCTNALLQAVRPDLDSRDRSGIIIPSGLDANTISLLQYLEDEASTGTGNVPEVSASRDNVLVPFTLFPVPSSLVSRFQGKRDHAYIGRRNGRRQGRTFIGRRKRNLAFDSGWEESDENDIAGRDMIPNHLVTEELAEEKRSGFSGVGSEAKNVRTFIERDEEGKPWHVDFKRARSFIGKRENPLEAYIVEQRGRTFIGKRGRADGNVLINIPSEVWQPDDIDQDSKRARSYIGKRNFVSEGEDRPADVVDRFASTSLQEKRARSFIGKRMDKVSEDKRGRSFIGKRKREVKSDDTRGQSFDGKREAELQDKRASRSFIGKRGDFDTDDKRARSFIGKRDYIESDDKRARSFIGKRDYIESDDKRARSFIGKRDYIESDDKRARSFIGKRNDFDSGDKRASRSFIGKREDFYADDKRARSFIGKRDDFDADDKRASRSFIGKKNDFDSDDKRASRSFIGKRDDLKSDDKKSRSFIGRRSNEWPKYMVGHSLLGMTNNTDSADRLQYEGNQVQAPDERSTVNGTFSTKADETDNELIETHKEQQIL